MGLSLEQIQRLAQLARLDVPPHELEELSAQLSQIVALVDHLSQVPTEGVEPMVHAFDLQNVLAQDRVADSLLREAALQNAPSHDGECFLVPPVMG